MTPVARRALLVVGAIVAIGAGIGLISIHDNLYRAEAVIVVTPYTNSLATLAFEQQIKQQIPGLVRLKVSPPRVATNQRSTSPGKMTITVVAVDAREQDAPVVANAAGLRLSAIVSEKYGVTASLVKNAEGARSYSYVRDGLEPALAHILKR